MKPVYDVFYLVYGGAVDCPRGAVCGREGLQSKAESFMKKRAEQVGYNYVKPRAIAMVSVQSLPPDRSMKAGREWEGWGHLLENENVPRTVPASSHIGLERVHPSQQLLVLGFSKAKRHPGRNRHVALTDVDCHDLLPYRPQSAYGRECMAHVFR